MWTNFVSLKQTVTYSTLIKVNELFDSLHPNRNTKVVMASSGMW